MDESEYLSLPEVHNLPQFSVIQVTWMGGNGPHLYRVKHMNGLSYAIPVGGHSAPYSRSGNFDDYNLITKYALVKLHRKEGE